jgi:hypothetical protein
MCNDSIFGVTPEDCVTFIRLASLPGVKAFEKRREILSSHGGNCENYCFMGYRAV